MDNQNSIWYIILGSVLALVTTFVIELWKYQRTRRDLRNNFKTVFRLELKSLSTIIDGLTEQYGNLLFYPVAIIEQFDRNLLRLDNYRKDTIYLKDELKKEEILTCVNDLLVLASDIRSNENYQFNYINASIETLDARESRLARCKQQRQMYSLRTVDLKRRIQDIINYLS